MFTPAPRRLPAGDPLFELGDMARAAVAASRTADVRAALELAADLAMRVDCAAFPCGVGGCAQTFTSLAAHEAHVRAVHAAHRCATCGRHFPTDRLATLHAVEEHDALFALMAARGQRVFECLLDSCGSRFRSAWGRQRHMVDAHLFPRDFVFGRRAPRRRAPQPPAAPELPHGGGAHPSAVPTGASAAAAAAPRPVCRFVGTPRGCRNGSACRFVHPPPAAGPHGGGDGGGGGDGDVDMVGGLADALGGLRVAMPDTISFGARGRGRGRGARGGGARGRG